ncbi:MAG: homoserine kinase [Comamonadaceae bacterium]|jgi:homoserine kinase type II|uniref:homoserine kinase n=1 Tax=Hydrogenophaga sp. SNF1 TaxID=3098762 RepID=UPI002ACC220F|nr:homoserine kinase [Hydrogenophaga sp. SNF1]NCT96429.1 homoserine kinase [Comamonadaceae bacterium]WQB85032.1 homoserine kinase [Hydrogenophaga sp. SNF1]
MAVYTEVPFAEAAALIERLNLGTLTELRGIQGGIENTNYFVTSERDGQTVEHVLTVFERLSAEQLPFYLHLMKHLATHGIPVPEPAADAQGEILHRVQGKPAAVVDKLRGASELAPTAAHCAAVGALLARLHLVGRDFERRQPNLRGLPWWNETVPVVLPFIDDAQAALLRSELAYQNHVAQSSAYLALPRGPIHADLFRDNAMFEDGAVSGVFDFYFAGVDTWLFDIAVCLNDWCVRHGGDTDGQPEPALEQAFLSAYEGVRPLTPAERRLLPAMQRAGALRFWLSRLWDLHLPREAAMLQAHDPGHFQRVLRARLPNAPAPSAAPEAMAA